MSALADFLAGSTEGVWCEQELREEVQALRAENERLTAELARQNAANDMIAAERDAYQTSPCAAGRRLLRSRCGGSCRTARPEL